MKHKCICCGHLLEEDDALCEVCGLSVFLDIDEDSDFAEDMARQTIAALFKDIRIDVQSYRYEEKDGKLEGAAVVFLPIVNANQYEVGKTVYSDISFELPPPDQTLTVTVQISGKDNKVYRQYNLPISLDSAPAQSKLGVQFTESLRAKLVLGTGDNAAYSDEFNLKISEEQ